MMKLLGAVLAVLLSAAVVHAEGEGYDLKGSYGMYDMTAEMVILNKIKAQTDPATEKVMIDGMALKFEYVIKVFTVIDGCQVAPVYFSDKDDEYVFDYYVDGDKVVKIVLHTKNGQEINRQVYPK